MESSHKKIKNRPHLVIYTPKNDDSNDEYSKNKPSNQVSLKPLSSAKNLHQLKKFNFSEPNLQTIELQKKLKKLQKLEFQKQDLMRSLTILKTSAISAIAEKEDEIQKLKNKAFYTTEEKLQFFEREFQLNRIARVQLEDQKQQLRRQAERDRLSYIREIQKRESIIEQLYTELNQSQYQIERMEKQGETIQRKMRIIELQNQSLFQQLQMEKITSSRTLLDHSHADKEEKFNLSSSVASSIPRKSQISLGQSVGISQFQRQHSSYSDRFTQIENRHAGQILELTTFYEKRISCLRQIYQRELFTMPNNSSEKQKTESQAKSKSKQPSQQLDKTVSLNKSVAVSSFKARQQLMQRIDEQSQLQAHKLFDQVGQNKLSECYSITRKNLSRQGSESQFTSNGVNNKYIEYKIMKAMKKDKSKSSIQSVRSKQNFNKPKDDNQFMKVSQSVTFLKKNQPSEPLEPQTQPSPFWKNPLIFTCGMLAGGTLAKFLPKMFGSSG